MGDSLIDQLVKNLTAMWETWVWSLGWEDPLEKGKAIHSSILVNFMDCIVHGVTKSQAGLSEFHFHFSYNFFAFSFHLFFPIFLFSLLHSPPSVLEIDNFMPLLPHSTLVADTPLRAIAIYSKQEVVVIEQETTH